jgi:subtilase family serine protease
MLTLFALLAIVGGVVFYQHSTATHAASPIKPHLVKANPVKLSTSLVGKDAAGQPQFKCQLPNAPFRCYSPQQIATAYSYTDVYKAGITGAGRTIVIVDAYQSPTILTDLKTFDTTFGLSDPKFHIIAPYGITTFNPKDPIQQGWAGEITLDVEWAHAVAPGAAIDLVLAPTSNDIDLYNVTNYAVQHRLGDVISQSFGEAESCVDPALLALEHQMFIRAAAKNITVLASAGDNGAAQPTCDGTSFILSASSPASDPYVTGVGGTQLFAKANGGYQTELVWNESDLGGPTNIGGGGGFSTLYAKPDYQQGVVPGRGRGVPDVSYNAAVNGGVLVYEAGSFSLSGGTSAGSPQWAGIVALADQYQGKSLGFLNPTLYKIGKGASYAAAFHDILVGNNSFFFLDFSLTITGYNAHRGWDAASGWGSPIVNGLLKRV